MNVSRRSVLGGVAAISAGASAIVRARTSSGAVGDFRVGPRAAVKVHADLYPHGSGPWWYEIFIYAMRPRTAPLLMMKAEGCEHSFARSRPDGSYILRNATVSSFKDAATGRWLDEFANPLTGKRNRAKANVIEGGATIFSVNGRDIYRDNSDMKASQISQGPGRAGPWMPWMEMGQTEGHLLWHSAGRKLRSLNELPRAYRLRAEQLAPGLLAKNPFGRS